MVAWEKVAEGEEAVSYSSFSLTELWTWSTGTRHLRNSRGEKETVPARSREGTCMGSYVNGGRRKGGGGFFTVAWEKQK